MLRERLRGRHAAEIVERDDGYLDVSSMDYFAEPAGWPPPEQAARALVRGRVLDVGVGAGRWALDLQRRGHDVVGIDTSAGAVEVSRARGVRDVRLLDVRDLAGDDGPFDTVVMMGNNLGLLGGERAGRSLLARLSRATSPEARIVAAGTDAHRTDDPAHLRYHARNEARGRLKGQLRIRVRYRDLRTPWFDYLLPSVAELERILEGTGWRLERCLTDEGPSYIALLVKAQSARSRRLPTSKNSGSSA